ncbi:ABC transporter permease [Roseibium sp. M-1]
MANVNIPQGDALGGFRPSLPLVVFAWLILAFLLMPSLIVIPMSFGGENELYFPPRQFSLFLYEQYFTGTSWMRATLQSLIVAVFSSALSLFFGATAAYGISRSHFPGKKLLTFLLLSPMFVPLIVVALGMYIYFATIGLQGTTIGLIAAHTIYVTPFVIVMLLTTLRDVDPVLERAAYTMGAGRIYTFWTVTLPLMKNGLVSSALFALLLSFDELILAVFLTSISTKTLPVRMYDSIVVEISPVLAAISTLLTIIALVVGIIVVMGQSRKLKAVST